MKPSTIFERWIKANSARLEAEDAEFKHLVTSVAFYLDMIEMNEEMSPGAAESAVHLLQRFTAEAGAKGYQLPDVTMPKIKIVKPTNREQR